MERVNSITTYHHRFPCILFLLFLQSLQNSIESNLERLFKHNQPRKNILLITSQCNSSDSLRITLITFNDIHFFNLKVKVLFFFPRSFQVCYYKQEIRSQGNSSRFICGFFCCCCWIDIVTVHLFWLFQHSKLILWKFGSTKLLTLNPFIIESLNSQTERDLDINPNAYGGHGILHEDVRYHRGSISCREH